MSRSSVRDRKQTPGPDPGVLERLTPFVADLRANVSPKDVLAVVVVGSAARGEQWSPSSSHASDVDLMVVTRTSSLLLGRAIARVVSRHGDAGIEGGQVPLATLRRHRTLLNYEARWTGCVVEGDQDVLEQIPMRAPADIPRWEAVRLLFNRLMEHVKLRAGLTTPAHVVQKSYEALGEALLVIERRYRPTFRERLDELRRQPLSTDAGVNRVIVEVLESRVCGESVAVGDPQTALTRLYAGLDIVLERYVGARRPLPAQLDHIARIHRHWRHRLYWFVMEASSGSLRPAGLTEDPSIGIWRRGLDVLELPTSRATAETVVNDWARCPQILDAKDTL